MQKHPLVPEPHRRLKQLLALCVVAFVGLQWLYIEGHAMAPFSRHRRQDQQDFAAMVSASYDLLAQACAANPNRTVLLDGLDVLAPYFIKSSRPPLACPVRKMIWVTAFSAAQQQQCRALALTETLPYQEGNVPDDDPATMYPAAHLVPIGGWRSQDGRFAFRAYENRCEGTTIR